MEARSGKISRWRSDGSMTEKELEILLESERIMRDKNIYTSPIIDEGGELIGVALKDSLTADKVAEILYSEMR